MGNGECEIGQDPSGESIEIAIDKALRDPSGGLSEEERATLGSNLPTEEELRRLEEFQLHDE